MDQKSIAYCSTVIFLENKVDNLRCLNRINIFETRVKLTSIWESKIQTKKNRTVISRKSYETSIFQRYRKCGIKVVYRFNGEYVEKIFILHDPE